MMQGAMGGRPLWLAIAPVMVIFAIAAWLFASAQNIWVDETTQLSGITLAPGALLAWLAGDYNPGFGVPADRMPPFSYFIDMLGWRLWGQNEMAFRLYHAVITALGLLALMVAMARRYGLWAALVAGLLLALSPKLIATAVEIRSYPILMALSCAQVALLLLGDVAARPRRLALFVLLGVLSGYTHFFGIVATSAYFGAVFIDARDVKGAVRVVLGYALLLLLWTGLFPFIFGASAISAAGPAPAVDLSEIAAFFARMLAGSEIMVTPAVALLYFAGAGLLLVSGAVGLALLIGKRGIAARHEPAVGLAVALVLGVAATLVAGMMVASFDALASRYSLWMLPPLVALIAIFAVGGIAPPGRAAAVVRWGSLALLAIGAVLAQILFLSRADWFIHGPSRTLGAMVAQAERPLAVVHVGEGWAWGYFPLYRVHRDTLPQWLLAPDGNSVIRLGRGGDANGRPQPLSVLDDQKMLLVSRIQLKTYQDLRALAAGAPSRPVADPPGIAGAGWQAGEAVHRPGNYSFTGRLYERPAPRYPAAPRIEDRPE